MKKLLLTLILIFISINSSQAYIQWCVVAESEMNNYTEYKTKIDIFFEIISEKDVEIQEGVYKKLQTKLADYIEKIDSEK